MSPSVRLLSSVVLLAILAGQAEAGERYAFLVGVKKYKPNRGFSGLPYAENDVTKLAEVLKRSGYDEKNIVAMTLTAGSEDPQWLPDAASIRDAFDRTLATLGEEDSLIVGFSGHGVQFKGEDDAYFCPMDADLSDRRTLISLKEVYDALDTRCAAGTKLLLVDACRKNEAPPPPIPKGGEAISPEVANLLQQLAPPLGVAALFSCSAGELSWEDAQLEHGVFFHFVIEALSGKGDANGDREVSLAELEQYTGKGLLTHYAANRIPKRQTPRRKGGESYGAAAIVRLHETGVITNSLGMQLALIPTGEFRMGSDDGDADEKPPHRVRITKPFYLGAHEVTRGQFAAFVAATGHKTEAERDGQGGHGVQPDGTWTQAPQYTWRSPGFPQADEHPVVNVSWNDAVAFCEWLGRKEGATYRLPTEAEWEYACRAGTTTAYACGDDPEGLALVGNVADAAAKAKYSNWTTIAASDGYVFSSPVGNFRPNAFGLYDTHGNVWEWCADWYDSGYYAASPAADPPGLSSGSGRVIRGGGWFDFARICRSADRYWHEPSVRYDFLGFRVARVPSSR